MSTAQVVFAIALGSITLLITFFAIYVASSTVWGDRWIRRSGGNGKVSK
jgi:hypothetical protein